jgi:excisionase family DNA binding protein
MIDNQQTLDRFMTVDEARRQLCLGTTAIYALMKQGELRKIKLGQKTVFLASDIQAFIDRKVAEADALVCA